MAIGGGNSIVVVTTSCLLCAATFCFLTLDKTPTWIVYGLTLIFTPMNYFLGSGYTEVASAPMHQGIFSHDQVGVDKEIPRLSVT